MSSLKWYTLLPPASRSNNLKVGDRAKDKGPDVRVHLLPVPPLQTYSKFFTTVKVST
jgi:hypothetical protein